MPGTCTDLGAYMNDTGSMTAGNATKQERSTMQSLLMRDTYNEVTARLNHNASHLSKGMMCSEQKIMQHNTGIHGINKSAMGIVASLPQA